MSQHVEPSRALMLPFESTRSQVDRGWGGVRLSWVLALLQCAQAC